MRIRGTGDIHTLPEGDAAVPKGARVGKERNMTSAHESPPPAESRHVFWTLALLGLAALAVAAAVDRRPVAPGLARRAGRVPCRLARRSAAWRSWKNGSASEADLYVVVHDAEAPDVERSLEAARGSSPVVRRREPAVSVARRSATTSLDGGPLVRPRSHRRRFQGRPFEFLLLESGAAVRRRSAGVARSSQVQVPDDRSEVRRFSGTSTSAPS